MLVLPTGRGIILMKSCNSSLLGLSNHTVSLLEPLEYLPCGILDIHVVR